MKKRRLKKWVENSLNLILVALFFALMGEIDNLMQFIIVKTTIVITMLFIINILRKYEAF
jgi:hypothetical protein